MMRTFGMWVAGAVMGVVAVGCSGGSSSDPFGSAPDFASIDAKFQTPSGTLQGHEAKAFDGMAQQSQAGSSAGFFGGSSAGAATGATQAWDHWNMRTLGNDAFCSDLGKNGQETGSCSCPGGGSIQYDFSGMKQLSNQQQAGQKIDATLKLAASACRSSDGQESVDGHMFLNYHGTVPAAGQAASASDFVLIYDVHFVAVDHGQTEKVDADFEEKDGKVMYSVEVDDGNVVVSGSWDSSTKTGHLEIRDKGDSWTCDGTDGKTVTCTSAGGQSRTITL